MLSIKANSMIRKQRLVVELIYCAGWPIMTEEQLNLLALWYETVPFGSRAEEQMGATPLQLLLPKPNRVCKSKFSV